MQSKWAFKILLIVLLSNLAHAEMLKNIQSFSADFVQYVESSDKSGILTYRGKILALSPASVRWTYIEPILKEVYIHEEMMIVYEPKLKQAIISHLRENVDLLGLLKVAKKVQDNVYEAVILEQKYILETKDGILERIGFNDHLGNVVQIFFSNIVLDINIDSKTFEFIPTSDLDIIYR